MSFSISLSSMEKDKVFEAAGNAIVKQNVSFAEALFAARYIRELLREVGGELAAVSASGHAVDTDNGYISVNVSFSKPLPVVLVPVPAEVAQCNPAPVESGPLETAEGAVVEAVHDTATAG